MINVPSGTYTRTIPSRARTRVLPREGVAAGLGVLVAPSGTLIVDDGSTVVVRPGSARDVECSAPQAPGMSPRATMRIIGMRFTVASSAKLASMFGHLTIPHPNGLR